MSRKLLFAALAAAMAFSTFAVGAASSGGGQDPHDKVWVCHSTASESNPWILIHIKKSGWLNGHKGLDAHPGHLAEDRWISDSDNKKAFPHGPAGAEQECGESPPTSGEPPPN